MKMLVGITSWSGLKISKIEVDSPELLPLNQRKRANIDVSGLYLDQFCIKLALNLMNIIISITSRSELKISKIEFDSPELLPLNQRKKQILQFPVSIMTCLFCIKLASNLLNIIIGINFWSRLIINQIAADRPELLPLNKGQIAKFAVSALYLDQFCFNQHQFLST